jgi:hypothetical protein
MTKLHKAKILDELGIEYQTTETGEMICLVKTNHDEDSKEWLNAGDVINEMEEQGHIKVPSHYR